MKKIILSSLIAISVLSMTGCFENENKSIKDSVVHLDNQKGLTKSLTKEQIQKNQDIFDNIIKGVKGISFGNSESPVIVFFDPQCIHCHELFINTQNKEFNNQKFIWVPLGYLNELSILQSETILSAENPAQTLIEHENTYGKDGKGITPLKMIGGSVKEDVIKNNEIFKNTKFGGVPVMIKINSNGELSAAKGGLPVENIKEFILQ